LAIPIPIHLEKCIANTNANINFKKGLQYQYFFGIAEAIPILGLEETVSQPAYPGLTHNYRSISHCCGQPATTD